MLPVIATAGAALLAGWIGLLLWYVRPLIAFWREPAFRKPVLIFESDDWGPAPPDHAETLSAIADLLRGFSDRNGHRPVMTLAVVLAILIVAKALAAHSSGQQETQHIVFHSNSIIER